MSERVSKIGFDPLIVRLQARGGLQLGNGFGGPAQFQQYGSEGFVAFRDLRRQPYNFGEARPRLFELARLLRCISRAKCGVGIPGSVLGDGFGVACALRANARLTAQSEALEQPGADRANSSPRCAGKPSRTSCEAHRYFPAGLGSF